MPRALRAGARRNNVRICAVGFLLIFTAFNTAQNYMTTLLGADLGADSLSLIFGGASA